MNPHELLAMRIVQATEALLGQQPLALQIGSWCEQYRDQCSDIVNSRGISLSSVAIVGAKGQGKTWVARQIILDRRLAESLPSGVLSSEATTHLHWIGPVPPDGLDSSRERYHPCSTESLLPLERPYMLLDTPGVTDDDASASRIAKEALALSPIKLLVARRDQLRGAINSYLAHDTEGSICIPIVTCVPLKEIVETDAFPATRNHSSTSSEPRSYSDSLARDLDAYCNALRSSAPLTRYLEPILIADFEADGDETRVGQRLARDLTHRLQNESLDQAAATKANRLAAAGNRLRHRVGSLLELQLPQLATAVRRLHSEADALPTQTIESVLGSRVILQSAIRSRLRAQAIADTSMLWFPYRTVLTVLGLTHGAWDRLILSLSGSIPSIFGTFAAWARNVQQSRKINWEMHEGIRDRLNGQIQDRLEPVQAQFYRAVARLRGNDDDKSGSTASLKIRLTGVEELQSQARSVFEWTVDRFQSPKLLLQGLGLIGTAIFWSLMAGPIVWIYRQFLTASFHTLSGAAVTGDEFPHPSSSLLITSVLLSLLPLVIYAMVSLGMLQRNRKINHIAEVVYAEELKLVEELKRTGVIALHYDDPLLEHAEFLINIQPS